MDALRSLSLSLVSVNQVRSGAEENPFGLGVLGYVTASLKLQRTSDGYFHRARVGALGSSSGRQALVDVLHMRASYWISVGRLDEADRVALESVELSEAIGDLMAAAVGMNLAAICDYLCGRFERMLRRSERTADASRGDHRLLRLCGLSLALCALGRAGEALERLQAGLGEQPPRLGVARATVTGTLALAHARAGALPAAWEQVQRSLELGVSGAGVPASCGVILEGPLEAAIACWAAARDGSRKVAPHERAARRLLSELRAYAKVCRPGLPLAWYYEGHVQLLGGNLRAARRAWSRAVEHSARLGMPYCEGRAHRQLARVSRAGSEAQRLHLERAQRLVAACRASTTPCRAAPPATTRSRPAPRTAEPGGGAR
jgi:hypothetical protein